jgi:hypothetical protein
VGLGTCPTQWSLPEQRDEPSHTALEQLRVVGSHTSEDVSPHCSASVQPVFASMPEQTPMSGKSVKLRQLWPTGQSLLATRQSERQAFPFPSPVSMQVPASFPVVWPQYDPSALVQVFPSFAGSNAGSGTGTQKPPMWQVWPAAQPGLASQKSQALWQIAVTGSPTHTLPAAQPVLVAPAEQGCPARAVPVLRQNPSRSPKLGVQ